ncbi:MAG TPA: LysR family transcriptional regulator [Gemmobacter sp.]|nr:LysR family transcriptional regulator [Gemmobacter sp.]
MRAPRRFLPSLPLLSAFEAAARTGSVTRAAEELSLTQSAVSRQIRALEEQVGVALFHREKQTIRLTAGGAAYAREVREALAKISAASLTLRANPMGGTLTLAAPPALAARWLLPRLPLFLAAWPAVQINLVTRAEAFDFKGSGIDAALYFGKADWPGAGALRLMGETVLPVSAPFLSAQYTFASAPDLRRAPLLHLTSRPDAWEVWLRHHSADAEQVYGQLFDQFDSLAAAAMAGLGIALLPEFLFQDELTRGLLVPALPLPLRSQGAYHLCWPEDRADHPALIALRDWLLVEAGHSEAD